MDVTSYCPVPIGALFWQAAPGTWALTVACKATYRLSPGVAELADEQDHLLPDDVHHDDDPGRSVRAPCDLVPWKPVADVLVVGHAFAPPGQTVTSLVARVCVGNVDKAVEVVCGRGWNERGELVHGRPFSKRRLQYERAGGGPGTTNPAGIAAGAAPDAQGLVRLPDLQPPGFQVRDRATSIPPVGLGPIAPDWPPRAARLGAQGKSGPSAWRSRPLPTGFDLTYFQAAPADQWTPHLRGDETLVLEHLHPDHAVLAVRLPGLRPSARLESIDGATRPLAFVADTLWIDTDRAVCTLVWRAQTALGHPLDAGRVTVTLETQEGRPVSAESRQRTIRAEELAPQWSLFTSPPDESTTTVTPAHGGHKAATGSISPADAHRTLTLSGTQARSALPFQPAAQDAEAPPPRPSSTGAGLPFQRADAQAPSVAVPAVKAGTPPAGIQSVATSISQPPPWPPAASLPASVPPPPPSVAVPPAPVPPPVAVPPPPLSADMKVTPERAGRQRLGARASEPGEPGTALAFSNAAAGASAAPPSGPARPAAAPRPPPAETVELLWFDPALAPRLRHGAEWKKLLASGKQEAREPEGELSPEQRKEARQRRDVLAVLRYAQALDVAGLERALKDAAVDGVFTAPLVVVSGELEPLFDEVEALKTTLAVVSPFTTGDKRLKESVEWATELLHSPGFETAGSVAEGVIAKVREVFAEGRRALPAGYLDTHVERALVRQRRYQKRTVLGAEQVRCTLRITAGAEPAAAYLPEASGTLLPLFRTFRVRLVAEARPPFEPGEPLALSALAVATVVK